jgi:hypothetical protein
MKREIILFSVILLVLVGIMPIAGVDANPYPIPWSPTPNQDKPTLSINSPKNYSTIEKGKVLVDFNITVPQSWDPVFFPGIHYIGELNSVDVYLDGNLSIHCINYQMDVYSNGNKSTYYSDEPGSNLSHLSIVLNNTDLGVHTLNVTALSYTYYTEGNSSIQTSMTSDGKPIYRYPIVVSDMVSFTVKQPTNNSFLDSVFLPATITVIAIVAVASLSLVYYKKRGGKT